MHGEAVKADRIVWVEEVTVVVVVAVVVAVVAVVAGDGTSR